jgi:hypothetical protein
VLILGAIEALLVTGVHVVFRNRDPIKEKGDV